MLLDALQCSKLSSDFLIFESPHSIFAFLLSGISSESLAHITRLRIQFPFPYSPDDETHDAYLVALRIVLRIVPNLQDLVLLWTGVPVHVFDGVNCSLDALTCTMALEDIQGLEFLASQDRLQLLELPYWASRGLDTPIPHAKLLLPDLCEVSLPPAGLIQLVPGRPVRAVDVRLVGSRMDNFPGLSQLKYKGIMCGNQEMDPVIQLGDDEWPSVMHALQCSTSIIDDLAIATIDLFNPAVQLRAIAAHLPMIQTLYIRIYTPQDSMHDTVQWATWSTYLARLPHLESMKIEFDCSRLPIAETSEPRAPNPRRRAVRRPLIADVDHKLSFLDGVRCAFDDDINTEEEIEEEEQSPRPLIRFSIPTQQCVDVWWRDCCPYLENVYIGVFSGDALVDWSRPRDDGTSY